MAKFHPAKGFLAHAIEPHFLVVGEGENGLLAADPEPHSFDRFEKDLSLGIAQTELESIPDREVSVPLYLCGRKKGYKVTIFSPELVRDHLNVVNLALIGLDLRVQGGIADLNLAILKPIWIAEISGIRGFMKEHARSPYFEPKGPQAALMDRAPAGILPGLWV